MHVIYYGFTSGIDNEIKTYVSYSLVQGNYWNAFRKIASGLLELGTVFCELWANGNTGTNIYEGKNIKKFFLSLIKFMYFSTCTMENNFKSTQLMFFVNLK